MILAAIVIPTFNGGAMLRSCLESVAALRQPRHTFEVIVVDNNSTDDTPQIIAEFGFRYIKESTHQSSYAARNAGIAAASAQLIAFTDSDCVLDPDWLGHLLAAADRHPDAGCLAGEILSLTPTTAVERFSDRIGLLRQRGPLSGWHFKPYAQTANAAYRRAVFDRIGMFDPTAQSGGDATLAWRMLDETDFQIQFVPDAKVFHHHRTSVSELWKQFRRYGGGKLSWAKARPDYTPPSVADQEQALIDLVAKHSDAIVKTGLDEETFLDPVLQIVTKAAHLHGFVDALHRLGSRSGSDVPQDLVTKCTLCGAFAFGPGPNGRLANGRPPQCLKCGALERHRVLHALAPLFAGFGPRRCLIEGESCPALEQAFVGVEKSPERAEGEPGRFDVIVRFGAFNNDGSTLSWPIAALFDRVTFRGIALIVHQIGPLPPRTTPGAHGEWRTGADFDWLASQAVPDASVLGLRLLDPATSVRVAVTAVSYNNELLTKLAAETERLHGVAIFAST